MRAVSQLPTGKPRRRTPLTRRISAASSGLSNPESAQYIKEGKNAIKWRRLSCRKFRNNQVRLQLHALAYNLGNFMRTLGLPKEVEHWSLTSLPERFVKTEGRLVKHAPDITGCCWLKGISRDSVLAAC